MLASSPNTSEIAIDEVAKSIPIPPRPEIMVTLQKELMHEDPDPRRLATVINRDVAISATLLKVANSSFYGLRRKAESVEQALNFIGMTQCTSIMLGLIARRTLDGSGAAFARFWDVSDKRAFAMALLSRRLHVSKPDVAHTFGLFCDIGIPLLIGRFPDYVDTLRLANESVDERFTTIEDRRHHTNHATIGSLLARNWGLSSDVVMAIRLHHEYEIIADNITPDEIKGLVALGLLVERAIQTYQHKNHHVEWEKGGGLALDALGISEDEMLDTFEELHRRFDEIG